MARRIKEDPIVHQNRIAEQAMLLFAQKGIENTKMDEIAALSGYSKATLYVYFKNKEDIISFLAFQSMKKLKNSISSAISEDSSTKDTFMGICNALVKYEEEYPSFFKWSLGYISVNTSKDGSPESQAYEIGEEINELIASFIRKGIERGDFAETDGGFSFAFHMWGMVSGLISLGAAKEEYLKIEGNMTKEEFLQSGFERIYKSLCK